MIVRGLKYKLAPTAPQEASFQQFSGVCRVIYNAALFQREHFWRQYQRNTGKHISYVSQAKELTQLRAEFDWIAAVSQTCQQQALRDLDKAYQNFFAGRTGYPTPRRKGRNDSFRFQGRECTVNRLNRNWASVCLPKIGPVRFRLTRPVAGKVKNVTISHDSLGWHVSFACEIEHKAVPTSLPPVGIDRGVANAIALSTGDMPEFPIETIKMLDRRCRNTQKAMARRKRGSTHHAVMRRRGAALKAKAARIRRHWNHVQTRRIARCFGIVCLEDLRISNMTASARGTIAEPGKKVRQKAGLNRSILEHGWHQFEVFLTYKLTAAGGEIRLVNPRNTSRRCSVCHTVDARNRKSQALFQCVACGHKAHADVNAAVNILHAKEAPVSSTYGAPRSGEKHRICKSGATEVGTRPSVTTSVVSRKSRCAA